MMQRFNNRIGAGVLLGFAALYMVISLATDHDASAQPKAELQSKKAGLSVWQALALLAKEGDALTIVDVRSEEQYNLYHLLGSINAPKAESFEQKKILIIAENDAQGARIAQKHPGAHFLKGGAPGLYLALELPVPLFAEKAPPFGYRDALDQVRAWLKDRKTVDGSIGKALNRLANTNYEPDRLANKKKPKSSGKKKKITGGCG